MRASFNVVPMIALLFVGCRETTSPNLPATSPSLSASASTEVITVPVTFRVSAGTVAAIEACVGEELLFLGNALLVIHQTTLPDGSSLFVFHSNPQGAIAVGLTSGSTFRIAASDIFARVIASSGGFSNTFAANIWVIGPQGSPRFGGPVLLHFTGTPAGDLTAEIVMFEKGFQCIS
jgi:hypothetical protein